jgi:hypothetical protein
MSTVAGQLGQRPTRPAPRCVIVLGLEERPQILWSAQPGNDSERLFVWLDSNHELRDLVVAAIELQGTPR